VATLLRRREQTRPLATRSGSPADQSRRAYRNPVRSQRSSRPVHYSRPQLHAALCSATRWMPLVGKHRGAARIATTRPSPPRLRPTRIARPERIDRPTLPLPPARAGAAIRVSMSIRLRLRGADSHSALSRFLSTRSSGAQIPDCGDAITRLSTGIPSRLRNLQSIAADTRRGDHRTSMLPLSLSGAVVQQPCPELRAISSLQPPPQPHLAPVRTQPAAGRRLPMTVNVRFVVSDLPYEASDQEFSTS
jgi:hypothetical protein